MLKRCIEGVFGFVATVLKPHVLLVCRLNILRVPKVIYVISFSTSQNSQTYSTNLQALADELC